MTTQPVILADRVFLLKCRERGLLFIADRPSDFGAAGEIIDAIVSRNSRINILASSAEKSTADWARGALKKAHTIPFLFDNRYLAGFNLRRLNVRAAVFMGHCLRSASPGLLEGLQREAISVLSLSVTGDAERPGTALSDLAELTASVTPQRTHGSNAATGSRSVDEIADLLAEMMARDLKILRKDGMGLRVATRLLRASARSQGIRSRLANRILTWRFRRLRRIDELATRLSFPQTILCLGNGPSSEHPTLSNMHYDALFRVNHSWQNRGILCDPDVVFTGGKPTIRAISGAIFGLQSAGTEARLIATKLFKPFQGSVEYFDVNDMTDSLRSFRWGHLRPTNGASMLAAAVALAPGTLIVAGIDLFNDPAGSYPGNTETANAYSPGHSRDSELAFVLKLLDGYRGHLVIVGSVLKEEWHRHLAQRPDREQERSN